MNKYGICVSGSYKFFKNNKLIATCDNVITDGFLSRWGVATTGDNGRCYLGSGNTSTSPSDIGLETFIASSNSVNNVSSKSSLDSGAGTGYKMVENFSWTYGAGTFTGTVREVGVRCHNSSSAANADGSVIDSRALIRDLNGDPAEIIITSGDTLTVNYVMVFMLPISPVKVNQTINSVITEVSFRRKAYPFITGGFLDLTTVNLTTPGFFGYATKWSSGANVASDDYTNASASGVSKSVGQVISLVGSGLGFRDISYFYPTGDFPAEFTAGMGSVSTTSSHSSYAYMFGFVPKLFAGAAGDLTFVIRYYLKRGQSDDTPLAVTGDLYPSSITESVDNGAHTTRSVSAIAKGGQFPYTYAWTRIVDGLSLLAADDDAVETTTFTGTGTTQNSVETWRCTVTDSLSDTATLDIVVDVDWS